jgi:uncharacterized protein (TIGR02996 family)
MHDDAGFLAVIRQTPADDTARLVFADWLDERDDPTSKLKAEFIRLELRTANEPADDYTSLFVQLQKLAAQLDPDWLLLVSRPRVEGCELRTDRECPSIWSRLAPAADPHVRTCGECHKAVRYCHALPEANVRRWRNERTVVSLAVVRRTDELTWLVLLQAEVDRRLSERAEPSRYARENELERLLAEATRDEAAAADAQQPERGGRPAPRTRRQKRRNRNIQRENWEDAE